MSRFFCHDDQPRPYGWEIAQLVAQGRAQHKKETTTTMPVKKKLADRINNPRELRIKFGPPTQRHFERIVDEAANLRMRKVGKYGEARYNDPSLHHAFTLLYADIYRKFIRIQNAIVGDSQGISQLDALDGENMRDTLLDLANYSLMGVHLLDLHGLGENIEEMDGIEQANEKAVNQITNQDGPRIDQIAFVTADPERVKQLLSEALGRPMKWSKDVVHARGEVCGVPGENTATLNFNYDSLKDGMELELLTYTSGPNWLRESHTTHGLSHLGMHVDDLDESMRRLNNMGFQIVQQVKTVSHTNLEIKDSRRYRYVIYDTVALLGFYLKLIQRLSYPEKTQQDSNESDRPQPSGVNAEPRLESRYVRQVVLDNLKIVHDVIQQSGDLPKQTHDRLLVLLRDARDHTARL